MTEEEALERLDSAFRQAIAREFDKDKEYGYRHLVDLSAGLDSRMVCFVAHDMGYTDQLNITYSKLGYQDDTISGRMAKYLGHEYLFKSLDDIRWMYDIDEMALKNNGAAIALGMTGGNRLLKTINTTCYGIEHTGMIGGPTMASYYKDRDLAYGKPRYGLNSYSSRLHYEFDEKVLAQHKTQEAFAMNTRGLLGMQVSYMTRQNYLETSSPFADVDMLETAFSIPFEYRRDDRLYLKWIEAKYPDAAKFGWEKWGGIQPKKSHIFFRKIKTTQRLLHGYLCRLFHVADSQSMNPMDYWYNNDEKLRSYLQEMYETRIGNAVLPRELAEDMKMLYRTGNFTDKGLVLTVLSAVNNYFN
jgi:asparagine synthase (glutamine-hydrolysing)